LRSPEALLLAIQSAAAHQLAVSKFGNTQRQCTPAHSEAARLNLLAVLRTLGLVL